MRLRRTLLHSCTLAPEVETRLGFDLAKFIDGWL